jgi:hypothetical protein
VQFKMHSSVEMSMQPAMGAPRITLCLPSRLNDAPMQKVTMAKVLGKNVVDAVNMPLLDTSIAQVRYASRIPPVRATARHMDASANAHAKPRIARSVWNWARFAAAESSNRCCGNSTAA